MKPSLVVIGLGNPGASYATTRHNAGFQAIDALSEAFGQGAWKEDQKFLSLTQEARVVTVPILLVKPLTYMNRSGEAARKIVTFFTLDPAQQLLVFCDEVDLLRGTLRLRKKGSAGTHNGLKSLFEQFGENYPRVRIGVGPKPAGEDLAAWVLSSPPPEEKEEIQKAIATAPDILRSFVMENGGASS